METENRPIRDSRVDDRIQRWVGDIPGVTGGPYEDQLVDLRDVWAYTMNTLCEYYAAELDYPEQDPREVVGDDPLFELLEVVEERGQELALLFEEQPGPTRSSDNVGFMDGQPVFDEC